MKNPFSKINFSMKKLFSKFRKKGQESVDDYEDEYHDDEDEAHDLEDLESLSEDYDYDDEDENLPPPKELILTEEQKAAVSRDVDGIPPQMPEPTSEHELSELQADDEDLNDQEDYDPTDPHATIPTDPGLQAPSDNSFLSKIPIIKNVNLKNINLKDTLIFSKDKLIEGGKKIFEKGDHLRHMFAHKIRTKPSLKGKSPFEGNALLEKFDFDGFFFTLMDVLTRPRIHKIFLLTTLICSMYLLGRMVAYKFIAAPITKASKRELRRTGPIVFNTNGKSIANRIESSDLFNAPDKVKQQPKKQPKVKVDNSLCLSSDKTSTLPIKLKDTIVLQDTVKSIASVSVRGSNRLVDVREGDKITNLARVGRINRQKIVFRNLQNFRCEFLENRPKKPVKDIPIADGKKGRELLKKLSENGIKTDGKSFKIKKELRNQLLGDIGAILSQARAVQIRNPDGSFFFKMVEIVPGSIYSKLNIQNGDIVTGINGKPITNLNELMGLFGKIREIDQFELSLRREGVDKSFEYNFE